MSATAERYKDDRLTLSIYAIVALYDAEQLSEGQATKLMNCPDRVSWRMLREKVHAEMRQVLQTDMKLHGWVWA